MQDGVFSCTGLEILATGVPTAALASTSVSTPRATASELHIQLLLWNQGASRNGREDGRKGMGVWMVKSVCVRVTPRPLSAILSDWIYQPRRGGKISIPVT